jgi:hypothetical protein
LSNVFHIRSEVFIPNFIIYLSIDFLLYVYSDYSKPQSSSFASPFAPQGLGESAMSAWSKSKEKKNEIGAVIANARNTGSGQTSANGYSDVGKSLIYYF